MTLNGPKQLNGPNGVVNHGEPNDFWFFFMDFYVGRPCENFRRIQWDTILECKKRGHWRPFEIQLCGGAGDVGGVDRLAALLAQLRGQELREHALVPYARLQG